jgi:hypothetical protein
MFTLTVATLVAAGEAFLVQPPRAMTAGLLVIVAGSLVTVARRTRLLLAEAGAR